ncbi:MAG: GspE/PulE family protein [Gammaproteobacteria bacterium]
MHKKKCDEIIKTLHRFDSKHIQQSPQIDELIKQLITHLITYTQERGFSDIHLEPQNDSLRIRIRADGLLYEFSSLPSSLTEQVITKLKVMASLDIGQKILPQDGRMRLNQHIRISTCPTHLGEKIVLRFLHHENKLLPIDALGFHEDDLMRITHCIESPQKLILVTGPTGSGKTTTLYSLLNHINTPEKNIMTIEDPVETILPGINQIQLNEKAGLTFEKGLRAFLRQDPDVIMIGEIRDQQTANLAIHAALTGHLVLATLHTTSTSDAITRLKQMNIPEDQINATLACVIAQRLFRKLCDHCHSSQGCEHCYQGYSGRFALLETLFPHSKEKSPNLKAQAYHAARKKMTSLTEIQRVLS